MSTVEQNLNYNIDSIKLLLDTSISEYNNEYNRTSILDSKVSIAFPIITAYFLALAPMNDYKTIFKMSISTFTELVLPTVLFVSYSLSLICAFVAVILMVKAIKTRDYKIIQPSALYTNDFLQKDQIVLAVKLITLYIEATESNKRENDLRIPLYRRGWLLTSISVSLFVVYIIMINNLK